MKIEVILGFFHVWPLEAGLLDPHQDPKWLRGDRGS